MATPSVSNCSLPYNSFNTNKKKVTNSTTKVICSNCKNNYYKVMDYTNPMNSKCYRLMSDVSGKCVPGPKTVSNQVDNSNCQMLSGPERTSIRGPTGATGPAGTQDIVAKCRLPMGKNFKDNKPVTETSVECTDCGKYTTIDGTWCMGLSDEYDAHVRCAPNYNRSLKPGEDIYLDGSLFCNQ